MPDQKRAWPFFSVETRIGAVVAALVALALIAALVFLPRIGAHKPLRFRMVIGGIEHWYQLSGTAISLAPGPAGFDGNTKRIYDAAPKLQSGDTPVLTLAANGTSDVFGVVRSDGTFIPFVDDGGKKADLAANADGLAAYTILGGANPELVSVNVFSNTKNTTPLGEGFSPAVTESGAVLALSSRGIIRIDPTLAQSSEVLLQREGLTYGDAALAPDASAAALPNAVTKQVDVFSLDNKNGLSTSYLGSVPGTPDAIAFVTPTEFVMHSASGLSLYTLGKPSVMKTASLTLQSP